MTVIALPALLLLMLSVALLVFLFVKLGRTGRIVLASLLLVPFLAVLAVIASFRISRASPPVAVLPVRTQVHEAPQADQTRVQYLKKQKESQDFYLERSRQIDRERSSQSAEAPVTDSRALAAAGFEPDLYASKESAVREVARLLAQQYKAMITSQDEVPRTLTISHADNLTGDGGGKASQVNRLMDVAARAVIDVFGSDAPHLDADYNSAPTSKPAGSDAPWKIVLHLSATRQPQPADGLEETGIIEGQIMGRLGQYTRQVEYVSKPWRDDFDRWQNSHEPASWVLGESEDFCPSRQESVDQSMRSAVPKIHEAVSRQLLKSDKRPAKRQPDWVQWQADLYRWLDDEAYRRLKAGDFQTDVFTQEFKRPYGSVWRSAMLVHVPPEKAKFLLDAYWAQADAQRTSWLRTAMSGAGLLMLIVMVYLFLNMATRGYYVWSVRLATAVLAAFGVWCIVMFVS